MNFQDVKLFLESWGLHYETESGESNDIPYPQVYTRMQADAFEDGGPELMQFIERITDTTDGHTYLTAASWTEIEAAWNQQP